MASLFKRTVKGSPNKLRSPFWWIKYRANDGKIVRESTGFKIGVGKDTRSANELCATHALRESKLCVGSSKEHWEHWVPGYLKLRYADSAPSLLRRLGAWRNLRMFLQEVELVMPRQLTRAHCTDFMEWREEPNKSRGKYRAGHNTAHYELKTLEVIMAEAVLRGYAPFNPCRDLEIHRKRGKEKPEFTAEALGIIHRAIESEPERLREFFRNSFDIAIHHGARLSETYLNPLTAVHLDGENSRITFRAKGGKTHTVLLHAALIPLFERLRSEGRTESYVRPASPAKEWWKFLKRHGIKDLVTGACFHSTRVTVASWLARNNVSEKKAMSYLGHASTTVSRAYVRLRPEDLRECADAISWSGGKCPAPKNPDGPSGTSEGEKPARNGK